ncbi:MAG TPA: energy transducer TonB [Gemmatimonadales bacterium]|nr:energy transducer TonB [Gemmatimonadales bacterium]
MFDNLIESKKKRQQTPAQALLSVLFHVILIVGAVKVTAGAAEAVKKKLSDTTMMFVEPPKPPPPPPDKPPPDAVVSANPPPQGFQTVLPPEAIPTTIPPVNLNQHFDARDFTGKGVEGGIAAGVVGGTGPVGQTYLEAQLDDPPSVIAGGSVRYPPALQSAGIAGSVDVQFIVDSTGHPEPGSFKVLKSTHPAFEAPAREAVMKTVFRPGKLHGQAVRVLVQQAVKFNPNQ